MTVYDDAWWRTYSELIGQMKRRRPLRTKIRYALFPRRQPRTLKEKEKAYRKIVRASYRRMYTTYPMIAYTEIMHQRTYFDNSPTLKARAEECHRRYQLQREQQQEMERQATDKFLASHPEARKYMPEETSPEEYRMIARVANEEIERLKTLRPSRRYIIEDLVSELKYRYTAIRYYLAFSLKSKVN